MTLNALEPFSRGKGGGGGGGGGGRGRDYIAYPHELFRYVLQ